jgi:predicted lipid-binding transport protein (Tim44 family)
MLYRRGKVNLITWRATAAGALSGLCAGLVAGILFGLFTAASIWAAMLVAGLGLALLCGAIFAIAAHLAVRGQRELGRQRRGSAGYDDLFPREDAGRARNAAAQARLLPPGTPAA